MEEVVGRNRKATIIAPVKHGEVKIFAEEEREAMKFAEFQQTVRQAQDTFIQDTMNEGREELDGETHREEVYLLFQLEPHRQ